MLELTLIVAMAFKVCFGHFIWSNSLNLLNIRLLCIHVFEYSIYPYIGWSGGTLFFDVFDRDESLINRISKHRVRKWTECVINYNCKNSGICILYTFQFKWGCSSCRQSMRPKIPVQKSTFIDSCVNIWLMGIYEGYMFTYGTLRTQHSPF